MIFLKDGKSGYSLGGSLPPGAVPITLEEFKALPENRPDASLEFVVVPPDPKKAAVAAEIERFNQESAAAARRAAGHGE